MQGPAVVGWLLTVLMGATGLYCLARLLRRRAPRQERGLDASEALKGLGMAAMALPYGLGRAVPVPLWLALFGAAALWSLASGTRGAHRGHHLYHGVGHAAMVYMALAMAGRSGGPSGMIGMSGMTGANGMTGTAAGVPLLTGALLVFFGGYALVGGLRLAGGTGGRSSWGGTAAAAGTARGTGSVVGRLLGAPELPQACRMTLGLGMFTMLLAL
ncbi:DUF5134 domain-containing protein [Streptacidiphilus sp. EB129]|uniref:DUF5134 domain-containing protein n=1 Tax=Streptacidiphilus sp. EB129 TaxID=3156262 RepID=UPI003513E3F0